MSTPAPTPANALNPLVNRAPTHLSTRFILILGVVFVIGLLLSYAVLSRALTMRVQDEVVSRSTILISLMNSVRTYTSKHVAPLINSALANSQTFIPETVPAYSAREVFENLRKNPEYVNFLYKEATLNPTSLRDKVDEFEAGVVNQFRTTPALKELSGYRTLNGVETFYNARPFAITDPACLACHSTPDKAPASLIRTYGPENGFGWQLNEIVAAQVIYIPAQTILETARNATLLVMAVFIFIFLSAMLIINTLLMGEVVNPIQMMAHIARKVTAGDLEFTTIERREMEKVAERTDEIGQSARVFAQMTAEVRKREETLTREVQALRVQVDERRKAKQVAEITESEYFQQLQEKVKSMKSASRGMRPTVSPAPGD